MLKAAIEKIAAMVENKTYLINGDTYSDNRLHRIEPHVNRPDRIVVNGLDSIVQMIMTELDLVNAPIFVQVEGHRNISVFTTYDGIMTRNYLYDAKCDVPEVSAGWRDHETAIIELRSRFIENEGTEYLLNLLSSISKEESATSSDNGVSQEVTARAGIALSQKVKVKPRVALRPYRTFLEIEQPESEFLLRLDGDGRVGLIEADGGMWRMEAKQSIVSYFADNLSDHISDGTVVVMM